jgi:hypothetical protein
MIHLNKHYEEIEHDVLKYRSLMPFSTMTRVKGYEIKHKYFTLYPSGTLVIGKGYACDGCSGPTIDGDNLHAGFAHDALYQLLRIGKLSQTEKDFNTNRKLADLTFYDQLKIDGMNWFRRWYYYRAVRIFGKTHAKPKNIELQK